MILVDREELYKEFRKDIMGGLNWEHILRTAKPYRLIFAVEKEIPKKPYELFIANGDQSQEIYVCPVCGSPDIDKECDNYCPKCGQKIDWEEKDEKV